jgi:ESS family glutamate:Na+ symporter
MRVEASTMVNLGVAETFAVAALVLLIGRGIIARIGFLRNYAIPEPVVGGLAAAVATATLHAAGIRIAFDTSIQPGLMLAFFATIGLGADARALARGGLPLVLFTACVIGMLIMENVIGIGAAHVMGIDPVIGLIAGSVTMAGGHGTGAAWGQRFVDVFGVTEAPAVGLATATFGLVIGGIIGGPVAMRLIRRLQAKGAPLGVVSAAALPHDEAEASGPFTAERLTLTILLIAASAAAGTKLAQLTDNAVFTLPAFVWTLLVGAVLRTPLALRPLAPRAGRDLRAADALLRDPRAADGH